MEQLVIYLFVYFAIEIIYEFTFFLNARSTHQSIQEVKDKSFFYHIDAMPFSFVKYIPIFREVIAIGIFSRASARFLFAKIEYKANIKKN